MIHVPSRFLFLALLLCAPLSAADKITLADGTKVEGWIVRLAPDSAFVLGERQARKVSLAGSTITFDLESQPRCAVVAMGRKPSAAEISIYHDGVLEGRNSAG